jgi:hypothetical protein
MVLLPKSVVAHALDQLFCLVLIYFWLFLHFEAPVLWDFRRLSSRGLACFNLGPRWVSIYFPVFWVGQLLVALVALVRRIATHHRL